eukprot:comp16815_c0_seq1/m.15221 comp16815_c0_seq1/g.15221  ORF comp16815_c0_seq1/g.15221 comp16815_c0_seq1/m.15221 type:complete len:516 (-) comp16815_c0_seq1:568-2115(-)
MDLESQRTRPWRWQEKNNATTSPIRSLGRRLGTPGLAFLAMFAVSVMLIGTSNPIQYNIHLSFGGDDTMDRYQKRDLAQGNIAHGAHSDISHVTLTHQQIELDDSGCQIVGGPWLPTLKGYYTFDNMTQPCGVDRATGIKLVIMKDMCIGRDSLVWYADSEQHRQELNRCCFEPETYKLTKKVEGCSDAIKTQCRATRGKIGGTDLKVTVLTKADLHKDAVKYVTGNSFWLHTPTLGEHFGHLTNRFMQWFVLNTEPGMPKFEQIVSRQFRPESPHLKVFADTIMGNNYEGHYFADSLDQYPNKMVCMQRAIEIVFEQQELPLFTREQGRRWREFASENFAQYGYKSTNQSCEGTPNIVVLQRLEGTGKRSIQNYDVIKRVLEKYGLTYRNVSVGGADGSDRQIGVFNDFSIMITSHSSQLKNLLWAQSNAVVLEARGTPPGYMQPSPFSMGMDPLEVIFHETVGHIPDYSTCPEKHGCRIRKKYKTDYALNETLFAEAFDRALREQRERCVRAM